MHWISFYFFIAQEVEVASAEEIAAVAGDSLNNAADDVAAAEDFKEAVESVANFAVNTAQEAVDDAVDGQSDQVRCFCPYTKTFRIWSSDSTYFNRVDSYLTKNAIK